MLENVKLSNNLKVLSQEMFIYSHLKNLTITKSVTTIGMSCFWACQQLEEFISESPYFKTFNKVLYSNDLRTLYAYPCNSFIDILPTTRYISNVRGFGATSFVNFIFNVSILEMGQEAFRECQQLELVDMRCTRVKIIHHTTFFNCPKLKEVILPYTIQSLDSYVFGLSPIKFLIIPHEINIHPKCFAENWINEVGFCGVNDIVGTLPSEIIVHVSKQFQGQIFMNHAITYRNLVCVSKICPSIYAIDGKNHHKQLFFVYYAIFYL